MAKRDNTPFTVFGSGSALRQFIYSLDLAELTVWALRHYNDDPSPITLAVDEKDEVPIREVALSIVKAMEFDGEVVFDTSMSDGQYKKTASNQKLRSYCPDYEFTPIHQGIQKAVDWLVDNYETCRK